MQWKTFRQPRFISFLINKGLFIQNATAAWRRSRRNGRNKIN